MAVKIRLQRVGKRDQSFFRIVVIEKNNKRNGKAIDCLGFYDPRIKAAELKLDKEKLAKWLKLGAKPTETARKLLNL